jgi:DNA-binding transcriptional ArsR family regulator
MSPEDGCTPYYVRMSARMHLSPAHGSHPQQPGSEHYRVAAEVLGLLADRTRLALLHTLGTGEADVGTLTGAVGASRTSVSQHLARLRLAGLVTTRKEGRRVVYALSGGHLRRMVDEALNLADHHISGTSSHE